MSFLSIDCSTDLASLFVKTKSKTFTKILQSDKFNNDLLMKQILDFFEEKKIDCPILYGGSVSKSNIEEIMSIPGIDGCLVGNSSLDGEQFAIIASKITS